jgi:hypothetical protein
MQLAMAEFWHYFSITLPVALGLWALAEWRQRRKRTPKIRLEPTLDGREAGYEHEHEHEHERGSGPETGSGADAECPHPRFKRVHVLRDGVSVATDEMQCVQCKQRMKA